jgi:hypothetical protein
MSEFPQKKTAKQEEDEARELLLELMKSELLLRARMDRMQAEIDSLWGMIAKQEEVDEVLNQMEESEEGENDDD